MTIFQVQKLARRAVTRRAVCSKRVNYTKGKKLSAVVRGKYLEKIAGYDLVLKTLRVATQGQRVAKRCSLPKKQQRQLGLLPQIQ